VPCSNNVPFFIFSHILLSHAITCYHIPHAIQTLAPVRFTCAAVGSAAYQKGTLSCRYLVSTVYYRISAVYCLLSAVCCLLSAVCCLLSSDSVSELGPWIQKGTLAFFPSLSIRRIFNIPTFSTRASCDIYLVSFPRLLYQYFESPCFLVTKVYGISGRGRVRFAALQHDFHITVTPLEHHWNTSMTLLQHYCHTTVTPLSGRGSARYAVKSEPMTSTVSCERRRRPIARQNPRATPLLTTMIW
jgi:hypothetical protein